MPTYRRWHVGVSTAAPHRATGGFSNGDKDFPQVPTERPAAWCRFLQVSAAPRTAGWSSNSGSLIARFLYCVVLVSKRQREKKKIWAKTGILGSGAFLKTGGWPSVLTMGTVTLYDVNLNRILWFAAKVLANGYLMSCIKERAHRCGGQQRKQCERKKPITRPAYVTNLLMTSKLP